MTSPPVRTKVFISYSSKDNKYLQQLLEHLSPYERKGSIDRWSDEKIIAGANWKEEIKQAIASAKVAVLLLSPSFLASEYIAENELPPLLKAAQEEGTIILPVLVRPCGFEDFEELAQFQLVRLPNMPLTALTALRSHQRDELWKQVTRDIRQALNSRGTETPSKEVPVPLTQIQQPVLDVVQAMQSTPVVQTSVEERYRQALLDDDTVTKLKVLEMNTPVPLSNIYVRLQVHEDMRHRYADQPKQQTTRDPLTLVQQRERLLEGQFRVAMEPADALLKHNKSVIIGDPGAGKTTLLKYLTVQAIQKQLPGIPQIPVYIRLNEFAISQENDLLSFAAYTWERGYHIDKEAARNYIDEQIVAGNVLLLLDALDETAVGSTIEEAEASYKRIVNEITRLSKRCFWMVVTARKAGYYQRGRLHAFTDLEILDFRKEEIEQFIDNWFEYRPKEEQRGDPAKLKQNIESKLYVQTLAANPLLLTLITLLYERHMTLPERRATLYQQCVEVLLQRWDMETSRLIQRPRRLETEYLRPLLRQIAWYMHNQGLRYIVRDTLLLLISRFLPTIGRNASQAQEILQDISGDTGLIREQGEAIYGFLHLTLQEYFASQHISDVSVLLAHLTDPWWEEVILLYTGGETHDASLLLEHLLVAEGAGEIPEDIFESKLLLAGRCLATYPTIQNTALWNEIPERLFRKLRSTRYAFTQRQVANTLAEIGRATQNSVVNQRLFELLTSSSIQPTMRLNVADALRSNGAHGLAAELLDFLVSKGPSLNESLSSVIGGVVAQLADRSLLPNILHLVSDKNTDPVIGAPIALSLVRIGDATLAASLLHLISDKTLDSNTLGALAYSIAELGDASTITSLVTLFAESDVEVDIIEFALLAFSTQRYSVAAPALVSLLSQSERDVFLRANVADALGRVGDSSTIHALMQFISNPTLDIFLRRACASALTKCALRTRQLSALTLLADETLGTEIRTAIAYEFAQAEDRRLLVELQSIRLRTQNAEVRTALLIVAGILGDNIVLGKLLALLLSDVVPTGLRQSVADVVRPSPAAKIGEILTDAQVDAQIRVALAQAIARTGRVEFVPDLLRIVANPVVIEEVRVSVAETIGVLSERRELVERMLTVFRSYDVNDPMRVSKLVDTMYEALWAMCRRAGVMIVQDGVEYKVLDR